MTYKLQKDTSSAGSVCPTLNRYSSHQSPVYQPPAAMCYSINPENITYTGHLLADQVFSSHLNVATRAWNRSALGTGKKKKQKQIKCYKNNNLLLCNQLAPLPFSFWSWDPVRHLKANPGQTSWNLQHRIIISERFVRCEHGSNSSCCFVSWNRRGKLTFTAKSPNPRA